MMAGSTPSVLFVEDSPDDAFFFLTAWGKQQPTCSLVHVKDGEEAKAALSRLRESGEPLPHLVLSDLKMPRCDGVELLEWVRSHPEFRRLPFVLWSSSTRPEDAKAAYSLGANGYVVKPHSMNETRQVVGCLKQYWCDSNDAPSSWPMPSPFVGTFDRPPPQGG